jgi:Cytochrome P450
MARPLRRRLAEVTAGVDSRDDILGALIEAKDAQGRAFSERELLDQIAMLFLAGHETSAAASAWALYLLALDPKIQERVRQEVAEVVGNGSIEFHHLKRLRLTTDVFREAMRLYPPVTFVVRDTVQDETLGTRRIEKGSVVFISAWLSHRSAALWNTPDQFDPDRFETSEGKASAKTAYLPFSQGPRVCPGAAFAMQEGVLILAAMVRAYRLSIAPGHVPRPRAKLTLRSDNGIRLLVEPLDQAGSTTTAVP